MSGVEPSAWICTRETTKGGRVFDEPFIATNRAYVEVRPLHDWSPLYSQATVDTLRAQLKAAEAETYAVEEASSEWREKFDARTIDWNEACAARDVWMQRAKDAQALLDAVGKEVESWRKPSPYMHGCCHEAVENMCDEIDAARTKEQQA